MIGKGIRLVAALLFTLAAWGALAQSYPARPITLIFPWPPGGADALPRAVAAVMSERLGQPVPFENRPGAGGTIGLAAVARSSPDGYTLGITDITSHAISASLYKKLPYDAIRDFSPVAMAARTPMALAVVPSLNVKTIPEFIALARSRPGQLDFASSGNGAITHLAVERLKRSANLAVVHIPYNGSAPAVASLLAGNSSAAFASIPAVLANARAGKLVLLGQSFSEPLAQLPDLPSIAQHVPRFEMGLYQGVLAPAGLPKPIVQRLHADIEFALGDVRVKEVMQKTLFEPMRMTPDQFEAFLVREARNWGELVNELGLKID